MYSTNRHEYKRTQEDTRYNKKININATNTIELINIYNINGQIIKSVNPNTRIISTSELSDGIYIVELSDIFNNKSTTKVKVY